MLTLLEIVIITSVKLHGQDRSNENHVLKHLCYPRNYIIFKTFSVVVLSVRKFDRI